MSHYPNPASARVAACAVVLTALACVLLCVAATVLR